MQKTGWMAAAVLACLLGYVVGSSSNTEVSAGGVDFGAHNYYITESEDGERIWIWDWKRAVNATEQTEVSVWHLNWNSDTYSESKLKRPPAEPSDATDE